MLNAALAIIVRDGLFELSTNRIASEAGISVGAIYQYFSNKEDILIALYQRGLDQIWEEFQAIAKELGDKPELDTFIAAVKERVEPGDRQEFFTFGISSINYLTPALQTIEHAHAKRICGLLTEILVKMGSNRPHTELERVSILAYHIYSSAVWGASRQLGGYDDQIAAMRDQVIRKMLIECLES